MNAKCKIDVFHSAFILQNSSYVKAEGVGFEPTMDCSIPVFKTGAFVHSAIPPGVWVGKAPPKRAEFYHRKISMTIFDVKQLSRLFVYTVNFLLHR